MLINVTKITKDIETLDKNIEKQEEIINELDITRLHDGSGEPAKLFEAYQKAKNKLEKLYQSRDFLTEGWERLARNLPDGLQLNFLREEEMPLPGERTLKRVEVKLAPDATKIVERKCFRSWREYQGYINRESTL
ncbi:hypothetical protein [Microbulbifer sp. JMSA003]|uniref:hypothetical protein n=1 Tax=unclassified Microbulbifer TaxID=2619833 RepID=UPI00403A6D8A